MRHFKSLTAMLLAGSMLLGMTTMAAAATSPTKAPEEEKYIDNNTDYHDDNKVVSEINAAGTAGTVVKITVSDSKKKTDAVQIKNAKNADGKAVPITTVGDGTKGVFNSKSGKKVTSLVIASKKTVTIKANAFKKSKVKKITVKSNLKLKKNAFKGTSSKSPTIKIQVKKSKNISAAKGAFTGLSSKAKIIVSKKKMSAKEFKKLKTKLKKAGFKGTITRK